MKLFNNRLTLSLFTALLLSACATSNQPGQQPAPEQTPQVNNEREELTNLDRAVPNTISNEIPAYFYEAIENGTRTASGKPGGDYWQQKTDYSIEVEILPKEKRLVANGTISYHNNSPDTLRQVYLELAQNLHKEGSPRSSQTEITGGVEIAHFSYNGSDMNVIERQGQPGYYINGTIMVVLPEEPLLPGKTATMETGWSFKIPRRGASGRMGYNKDNLIYIAYWYPKVRVYDDVIGWFTDPFLGNAEFYNEFGDFNVSITAPADWIVAATGKLDNAQRILRQPIYDRLQKAHNSDSVMSVVSEKDFGNITAGENEKVSWNFSAEWVNDFAFSVTKESNWDAARTSVGDLDGDGAEDYAHINAFYRRSAPLWKEEARYARHAIKFLSDFTGLSYPWPHMTSVEGGGIIGGGMEFPMMTIMGDYNNSSAYGLYAVTAHELAHMWIPLQLASNERRYAWMDEGTTTFNENQAKKDFFPKASNPDINDFQSYTQIVGTGLEGEIMRRSDYHYNGAAYGVASYPKPASVLVTLRHLLGKKTFTEAYHTFMERWQFKHPYPWDMFNTFEDVSGRDLDWFWRSWYYETWTLDQAVTEVTETENGTRIIIQDFGQIPMPAEIQITLNNGETITRNINVETWLRGATSTILTVDTNSDVIKVEIDPEHQFPDVNRSNNTWEK